MHWFGGKHRRRCGGVASRVALDLSDYLLVLDVDNIDEASLITTGTITTCGSSRLLVDNVLFNLVCEEVPFGLRNTHNIIGGAGLLECWVFRHRLHSLAIHIHARAKLPFVEISQ